MELENILGITDAAELAQIEERISKLKAVELYDKGILNSLEVGSYASLRKIHEYLFSEVYPFA